jgi:hypothetical protein
VTLIQRFGSAANLNIHLHCLVLDGVYQRTEGEPDFQEARAYPCRARGLTDKIIARLMKMLTRLGYLVEEPRVSYIADIDADNPWRHCKRSPLVWCEYADALALAGDGRLAGKPRELIDHAPALNNSHPRALETAGSAEITPCRVAVSRAAARVMPGDAARRERRFRALCTPPLRRTIPR